METEPEMRPLPKRRPHGRPVVDCPRCVVTFIGLAAHQAYADHSWDHVIDESLEIAREFSHE